MVEVIGLALEGLRNNLWGFRCPVYCSQPDIPLLLLTFLCGTLLGAFITFTSLRHYFGPVVSVPAAQASSFSQSRHRLTLYGY